MTVKRMARAKTDTKLRQRCQAFPVFSEFMDSSKESVLFSKSNMSASYKYAYPNSV
jgi:hypothetical protein